MPLTIRKPKIEDFNLVNQLITETFNIPNHPIQLDFFVNPKIYCFCAFEKNKIVGTASLHIIQKSNRKMGLIEDVGILPNYQGKGIGKQLIKKLVQKANQLNCYKTILNCTSENMKFYEKLGFRQEQLQMTLRP